MKVGTTQRKLETQASIALTRTAGWADLFAFWTGRHWATTTWPFLRTADVSRVTGHAFKVYRTLLMANQAAAEAICNTASRQQEVTSGMARAVFELYPGGTADVGAPAPQASWERIMAGYAEAYNITKAWRSHRR